MTMGEVKYGMLAEDEDEKVIIDEAVDYELL